MNIAIHNYTKPRPTYSPLKKISSQPLSGHLENKLENMSSRPIMSLLKTVSKPVALMVNKLNNLLLLPLESCTISLSKKDDSLVTLPLGQAMLVCGATTSIDDAQIIKGSCIALQMSVQDCNAIQPTRNTRIRWSDVSVFSASQQLSSLTALASRYVTSGIAKSISVVSALATMSFAEVVLLLSSKQSTEYLNLTDQNVCDVESYIDDNLEASINLTHLAKICDMSVSKFAKAFKAKTGMSPYKFVLSRRASLACELLQTSDSSLADIAYTVGFSSQSHMTEFFRRSLGVTPGKYRKMRLLEPA